MTAARASLSLPLREGPTVPVLGVRRQHGVGRAFEVVQERCK